MEQSLTKTLDKMRSIESNCIIWLLSHVDLKHWMKIYFPGHRFGHLTSNIGESLNKWFLPAHTLPIYPMLETMSELLMDSFIKQWKLEDKTQGIIVNKLLNISIQLPAWRWTDHESSECSFNSQASSKKVIECRKRKKMKRRWSKWLMHWLIAVLRWRMRWKH